MANPFAVASLGAFLAIGNSASPIAYIPIPNCLDIKFNGFKMASQDVTPLLAGQNWNAKFPTLLDGGDIQFTLSYNPAEPTHGSSTNGLLYNFVNSIIGPYKLVLNSSPVQTFFVQAFVSAFPLQLATASVMKIQVSLTITGNVIITG